MTVWVYGYVGVGSSSEPPHPVKAATANTEMNKCLILDMNMMLVGLFAPI